MAKFAQKAEKICILTTVHPALDIRIFHKQAKTLVKAGYNVTLIAPHARDETIEGVKIQALEKPVTRLTRMLKTTWYIWRKALKQQAVIYHFHDPELIPIALLLKAQGKKIIYDIHEDVCKQIMNKKWLPLPLRWVTSFIYGAIKMLFCRFFALVLAEASYAKIYPDICKKTIILNFPDLQMFPRQAASKKEPSKTIVYLGGVTKIRGISVIIEALRILHEGGTPVHFDCIGPVSDQYRAELNKTIEKYGLTAHTKLHGRLSPQEAYSVVAKADIGLAVLQPLSNYYEAYPTKMFEYMALGLPAIVSDFPLYKEIVEGEKCGLTVDPQDPQALATAIRVILDNPAEAERMGRSGRRAVEEKYNWEQEAKKLLSLYSDLLS